ncbi:hypothetical protein K5V21_03705 [Clostridium sardiniense]|uniref:Uncharacterized protein n=1 Tax=Clostridium sardiniense TaxID=29369 RepID=A0ABS7KUR2_CLOSR|nr:hypothetical protein [Clostridium sardiniense]MBY0754556.1 hypothetical protein [Clostridium sardiniense]MDQ0460846.1 hypothetical protein [Clostridium sardiniense]
MERKEIKAMVSRCKNHKSCKGCLSDKDCKRIGVIINLRELGISIFPGRWREGDIDYILDTINT